MRRLILTLALALAACSGGIDPEEPSLIMSAAEKLVKCEDDAGIQNLTCRYQRACEMANAVIHTKAAIPNDDRAADYGYAVYLQQGIQELAAAPRDTYPRAALAKFGVNFAGILGRSLGEQVDGLEIGSLTDAALKFFAKYEVGVKGYLADAVAHMRAVEAGEMTADQAFGICVRSVGEGVEKLKPAG